MVSKEILNDNEMEALLNSGNTGSGEEMVVFSGSGGKAGRNVREFNFRLPTPLSSRKLELVKGIHEGIFKEFQVGFSIFSKHSLSVKMAHVEQQRGGEFLFGLPEYSHFRVWEFSREEEWVLVEISLSLLLGLVDLLLGGEGGASTSQRWPTKLELGIVQPVYDLLQKNLMLGLEQRTGRKLEVQQVYQTDASGEIPKLREDASLVMVSFEVMAGEACGSVTLCYPVAFMNEILGIGGKEQITSWDGAGQGRQKLAISPEIKEKIGEIPLPIEVELGRVPILARDFLLLGRGDVLVMKEKIYQDLPVRTGEKVLFEGLPCQVDGQLGIKIRKVKLGYPGEVDPRGPGVL